MRYYIDTNILIYLMAEKAGEEIESHILSELLDCGNILYASSVCVQEMIHLLQIGKLKWGKKAGKAEGIMDWLAIHSINIVPVNERHLYSYAGLPLLEDHRDPNDRLIIAQAICDRIPLVSSDRKFALYERCGLKLVFNRR